MRDGQVHYEEQIKQESEASKVAEITTRAEIIRLREELETAEVRSE